ncbi:hypothetical protein K2X85_05390 [bacterium]|nr:hypothetical protein [bacterium]
MSRSRPRKKDRAREPVNAINPIDPREQLARLIGELLAKEWLDRQMPKSTRQDSVDESGLAMRFEST